MNPDLKKPELKPTNAATNRLANLPLNAGDKNQIMTVFLRACYFLGFVVAVPPNAVAAVPEKAAEVVILATQAPQIIQLKVKEGYFPKIQGAKANQPSILRFVTNKTFDCSLSVVIPSLKYSKTLPITGETDFALAAQPKGSHIDGLCTMDMYQFRINFE